jgi:general stress protein YciG
MEIPTRDPSVDPDENDPRDRDSDDVPETPLNEPPPERIEDPPGPADPRGPYTVTRTINTLREGGTVNTERKERRGFASMSAEKQREIASKGGRAAHEKGTAHEWTADEARSAGRKGGQVSRGGRGRLVVPSEAPSMESAVPPSERMDGNRPE